MKIDVLLKSLGSLPRPTLSPFFAARTAGSIRDNRRAKVPRVMTIYWSLLALSGGPLLLTSWRHVAVITGIALLLYAVVALTPNDMSSGSPSRR